MNGLSLFTGSGIGELAFKHIFKDYRTIGYVEIDKYCRSIIRARIRDGLLDDAPIFDDIRTFNERYAESYAGKVDWLSGGFPCQPFSVAGRRLGEADERNMWPATRDAIRILRPRYAFLENVPDIANYRYVVAADLSAGGYLYQWDTVSAAFVGAPHLRERWWCLATNNSEVRSVWDGEKPVRREQGLSRCENGGSAPWFRRRSDLPTPRLCRSYDGIPDGKLRVEACGNGWVPQVVARILDVRYGGGQ